MVPSSHGQIFDAPFEGHLQLLGRFFQRSRQLGLTLVDSGLELTFLAHEIDKTLDIGTAKASSVSLSANVF